MNNMTGVYGFTSYACDEINKFFSGGKENETRNI